MRVRPLGRVKTSAFDSGTETMISRHAGEANCQLWRHSETNGQAPIRFRSHALFGSDEEHVTLLFSSLTSSRSVASEPGDTVFQQMQSDLPQLQNHLPQVG